MAVTAAGVMTAIEGLGMAANGANALKSFFGRDTKSAEAAARQQYEYNLALQKQAQEWNEYMYKNRYQMQAEDLEKAGINKRYSFGGASSPTSGQGSVGMPNMVEEQNNKFNQFVNGIKQAYELKAMSANINNTNQKTRTEVFNTQIAGLEVLNKQIEIIQNKKHLNQMDERFLTEMEEARSRIINNLENTKLTKTKINQTIAETKGIEAENVKRERIAKWYNDHPVLAGLAIGGNELNGTGQMVGNATLGIGGGMIGKAVMAKKAGTASRLAQREKRKKR